MTNRSKDIGTWTATKVCRFLEPNGFPYVETRTQKGEFDQGDITGTPGICWEVKGGHKAEDASDGQVAAWLEETERERVNARADVGVLVMKRKGIGPANAGQWWAILTTRSIAALMGVEHIDLAPDFPVRMYLRDLAQLLRWAEYGAGPDELEAAS